MGFFNEYPGTNFHELNADWILAEVQQLIKDWSQTEGAWNALREDNTDFKQGIDATVTSLQNFVNTYFENLDVQNEINTKLTAMASDGTLSRIIAPYIQAQSSPIVVASTSDMTDNTKIYVLATDGVMYYYNGSQFVASDVIYGELDKITELSESITNDAIPITRIVGSYVSNQNGEIIAFNEWSRTDYVECNNINTILVTLNGNNSPYNCFYDENKNFISSFGISNGYNIVNIPNNAYYLIMSNDTVSLNNTFIKNRNALDIRIINDKLSSCVKMSDIPQITDNTILASLDECENNTIYRINVPLSNEKPTNCPYNEGVIYSIGWNKDGIETKIQYFVSNTTPTHSLYRFNWNNNWSEWLETVVSNSNILPSFDFGFIEKFAVIGDSYSSGEIYVDSEAEPGYVYADYYNKSWGQIIARSYGASCINLSEGGLTTKTWLESSHGLSLMNSSEPQELYLCALGNNDISRGINYLGEVNDIYTKADTFYGNYSRIIDAIKEKAPNAKIVLMTVAYTYDAVEDAYNEAILTIANRYGIPSINIKDDLFYSINSIYYTGRSWSHPTAPIYSGMAKANVRLFENCVLQNYNYFKNFIGN